MRHGLPLSVFSTSALVNVSLAGGRLARQFASISHSAHTSVPSQMQAVVLTTPGDTGNLTVKQVPRPTPKSNEILVKVDACGVCHRDVLDRQGAFPFIKRPTILGHEIAGTVSALGDAVPKDYKVGQLVTNLHWAPCHTCAGCTTGNTTQCRNNIGTFFGLTIPGGNAEFCVAPHSAWVPVPSGFTPQQACTIGCTYGTVMHAAFKRGGLKGGERVLVSGASGGVGSAMTQMAKAIKCHVTAVTSQASKVDYLRALGADHVIVSPDGQFNKDPFFKKHEIDMAFEAVGAPTFSGSLRSLRPGGRLVLIGNVSNGSVPLPLGLVIIKDLSVIGADSCTAAELTETFDFLKTHGITPNISRVLKPTQVAEAHQLLAEKKVTGRLVLSENQ